MINKVELRNKIFLGITVVINNLIIQRAKDDDYLIVEKDGKIVKVPAKELLKN
ncbi:MAG: hypothetical protein AB9882_11580 [Ignavibacteriaceae bacterium]